MLKHLTHQCEQLPGRLRQEPPVGGDRLILYLARFRVQPPKHPLVRLEPALQRKNADQRRTVLGDHF